MVIEQVKVCDALGTHFGIPRVKIREIAEAYTATLDQASPIMELDLRNYSELADTFYFGYSKHEIKLNLMFNYAFLEKSDLFTDVYNLFENYPLDFVVFLQNKKGTKATAMVIYPAMSYSGVGGFFLYSQKTKSGYVIESVKNYLDYNYPKEEV